MGLLQETFERAKAWVKELQRQASPNIVIALAGNKADLAEKRLVEYEVLLSQLHFFIGIFVHFYSLYQHIRTTLAEIQNSVQVLFGDGS